MLSKITQALSALKAKFQNPIHIFSTKENVVIIQIYPDKQALSLSYKGQVKTAKFADNSIKRMLKGGKDFEKETFNVFGAVVRLIAQTINYKE
jgi:hypothetical protein